MVSRLSSDCLVRRVLNETVRKAPLRRTVDACEVGRPALMLASDYASAITGETVYVDAGFQIEGMVFHCWRKRQRRIRGTEPTSV